MWSQLEGESPVLSYDSLRVSLTCATGEQIVLVYKSISIQIQIRLNPANPNQEMVLGIYGMNSVIRLYLT